MPPIAQDLIQNAKNFLVNKLKRATAEDLIVDEDAVSLPKVLSAICASTLHGPLSG